MNLSSLLFLSKSLFVSSFYKIIIFFSCMHSLEENEILSSFSPLDFMDDNSSTIELDTELERMISLNEKENASQDLIQDLSSYTEIQKEDLEASLKHSFTEKDSNFDIDSIEIVSDFDSFDDISLESEDLNESTNINSASLFSKEESFIVTGFQTANSKKIKISEESFHKMNEQLNDENTLIKNEEIGNLDEEINNIVEFKRRKISNEGIELKTDLKTIGNNIKEEIDGNNTKKEIYEYPLKESNTFKINNNKIQSIKENNHHIKIKSCIKKSTEENNNFSQIESGIKKITKEDNHHTKIEPDIKKIIEENINSSKIHYNVQLIEKNDILPKINNYHLKRRIENNNPIKTNNKEITTKYNINKDFKKKLNINKKDIEEERKYEEKMKKIFLRIIEDVKIENVKNYFKWEWLNLKIKNITDKSEEEIFNLLKNNIIKRKEREYSILRRIIEGDDISYKYMILMIINIEKDFIELFDGFYSTKFKIDTGISKRIISQKLKLFDKIKVFGAERIDEDKNINTSKIILKLHSNSIRSTNRTSKLGYQKKISFLTTIGKIKKNGGIIPAIEVKIIKILEEKATITARGYKNTVDINKVDEEIEKIKKLSLENGIEKIEEEIKGNKFIKILVKDIRDEQEAIITWWSPQDVKINEKYRFIYLNVIQGLEFKLTTTRNSCIQNIK
ncbi:hypothetical protein SLOPH_1839 [Spraguea lophii 42_110]|uniref:BRCA2 OB1 domain-containing protein n=1 Tax=Spraguea lophii (strain 42_110) TaxID=1358809 RepID=S7W713_SPRLO|nr:hypothetical protein SLOPH_1839 [Spraguea lophii 42_110]